MSSWKTKLDQNSSILLIKILVLSLEDTFSRSTAFNLFIHRATKFDLFFCALDKTNKSLLILGRWIRIWYWFFSITSRFCSIANFTVAMSKNQFSAFCEKTMVRIENLIRQWRFKIKFGAFFKKRNWKSDQPFSRY